LLNWKQNRGAKEGSPVIDEPFPFIDLPAKRSRFKPRRRGLTMMVDFGLTLEHTASVLCLSGTFIDYAKIAVGTARLYPSSYLKKKLALYKRHAVRPFIGGQFAEYVFATQGRQALPRFFGEAVALGFDTIEISDNCVPLNDKERTDLIGQAITSGLKVFGEVGSGIVSQPRPILSSRLACASPQGRSLCWWRPPSSSRAIDSTPT
jgi:phosphosulfolactate synthase